MSDPHWWDQAPCLGAGSRFFPASKAEAEATIAQYCDHCRVAAECATDGIRYRVSAGIWGGVWIPHSTSNRIAGARKRLWQKHQELTGG